MPLSTSYNLRIVSSSGFPHTYEGTDALSALKIIGSPNISSFEIYRQNGKLLEKIDLGTLEQEAALV